jgi:homoserine dehydrogenase
LIDKPGVLAKVSGILGEYEISVDRMRQTQHKGSKAPLFIVTHQTKRDTIDKALVEIEKLDVSLIAPIAIKIEEV